MEAIAIEPDVLRRDGRSELNPQAEALWLAPSAAVVALLWIAAIAATAYNGVSVAPLALSYAIDAARATVLLLALVLGWHLLLAAWRRERSPARRLADIAGRRLRQRWLMLGTVGPLILLPLTLGAFNVLKVLMPFHAPFAHDALFARIGRMLFSTEAWRVTHALFPSYGLTIALDRFYSAWMALLPAAIGGVALFAPRVERARFMLAMVLTWSLLGVAGAWLGSSAGPIFLELLRHPDAPRFDGLMRVLRATDAQAAGGLHVLRWRDVLWNAYVTRDMSFGMGISAMPSMHNAISTLYLRAAMRHGRRAGAIAAAYSALIFFSSIHLGWHYAVDGIVSVAAVWFIWSGVDRYLEWCGYDRLAGAGRRISDPAAPAAAA